MTSAELIPHLKPVPGPLDSDDEPTRVEVHLRLPTPDRARRLARAWVKRFYWAKDVRAEGATVIVYEKAEYADDMIEELARKWPADAEVIP